MINRDVKYNLFLKEDDIVTRKITRYRVSHKGWDFRDGFMEIILCVFLYSCYTFSYLALNNFYFGSLNICKNTVGMVWWDPENKAVNKEKGLLVTYKITHYVTLLCLMFIGLFKVITRVSKSSSKSSDLNWSIKKLIFEIVIYRVTHKNETS